MFLGRNKILIYTIVVLLQMRGVLSSPQAVSEYYEKQLADEVISYQKSIEPEFSIVDKPTAGNWITMGVLRAFENNLRFVLKLLSNFYSWIMPSREDAETVADKDGRIEVQQLQVSEPGNPFMMTVVCSLIPRLLTFLYVCTSEPSVFFELHRLHFVFCFVMPEVVAKSCPERLNESTYMCDAKTVTMLHELEREFPHTRKPTAEEQTRGINFVENVFMWVNGIDKKRMLTTLPHSNSPRIYVFGDAESNFFASTESRSISRYRRPEKMETGKSTKNEGNKTVEKETGVLNEDSGKLDEKKPVDLDKKDDIEPNKKTSKVDEEAAEMGDKKTDGLDERLRLLNAWYAKVTAVAAEEEIPVPEAVNRSVTSAFKTFMMDFGRVVRGLSVDDEWAWVYGRSDVIRNLLTGLNGVCRWAPLVLIYLADNCTAADTAVPFGLYLTLCGDWTGFLNVYCPTGSNESKFERACLVNTIADRLLVNFYWTMGNFSGYEEDNDNNDDEAAVRKETRQRITRDTSVYVKLVHAAVADYYKNLDDYGPVWTTSDWLTGKHFIPMSALMERPITLKENGGHRPAIRVLLKEAHDLWLPWNSDARNVFAFHAALFQHVDRVMDDFVYRHAKIIALYLRQVNGLVDETLINRLSVTLMWLADCEQVLRYYLSMPGPREPRGARKVNDVVSAIEKLKYVNKENLIGQNAIIEEAIPMEKRTELSTWASELLSSLEEINYLKQLNQMLEDNCAEACAYVNTFVFNASKSKIMEENPEEVQVNCKELYTGVFIPPNRISI